MESFPDVDDVTLLNVKLRKPSQSQVILKNDVVHIFAQAKGGENFKDKLSKFKYLCDGGRVRFARLENIQNGQNLQQKVKKTISRMLAVVGKMAGDFQKDVTRTIFKVEVVIYCSSVVFCLFSTIVGIHC